MNTKDIKTVAEIENINYKELQETYSQTLKSHAELYSTYGWANVTNASFIIIFVIFMGVFIKMFMEQRKTNKDIIDVFKQNISELNKGVQALNFNLLNESNAIKTHITYSPFLTEPIKNLPKRVVELHFKVVFHKLRYLFFNYLTRNNLKKNYNSICKELENTKTEIMNKLVGDTFYLFSEKKKERLERQVDELLSRTIEDFKTVIQELIANDNKEEYEK